MSKRDKPPAIKSISSKKINKTNAHSDEMSERDIRSSILFRFLRTYYDQYWIFENCNSLLWSWFHEMRIDDDRDWSRKLNYSSWIWCPFWIFQLLRLQMLGFSKSFTFTATIANKWKKNLTNYKPHESKKLISRKQSKAIKPTFKSYAPKNIHSNDSIINESNFITKDLYNRKSIFEIMSLRLFWILMCWRHKPFNKLLNMPKNNGRLAIGRAFVLILLI